MPREHPKFISTRVSEVRYYFLDLRPTQTAGITVVCGGVERCNADYRIDRRSFPFYSIEYVAEGQGEVRIGGRTWRLHAGSVFGYGPGIPHAIRNEARDPMMKYFVDFTGREAARRMASYVACGGVAGVTAPGEIRDLFEDLQRHGSRTQSCGPDLCAALVRVLILKIGALAVPAGSGPSRAVATYLRCKKKLEQEHPRLRTMEDAARACHVAPAYLCRLFRRFERESPYRYLTRLKMNLAAEMLLGSDRLVKDVAAELGFADSYHFSRVFKSVHQLSPARFLEHGHRG